MPHADCQNGPAFLPALLPGPGASFLDGDFQTPGGFFRTGFLTIPRV